MRSASISLETRATGFEYLLEDPLLSAVLAAESINGIRGEGVISTIKHYSTVSRLTATGWTRLSKITNGSGWARPLTISY